MTRARPALTAAAVVVAAVVLVAAGRGPLAPPPVSPRGVAQWLEERDAVTVAFSLGRLVALAWLAWVVALSLLTATARGIGAAGVARVVAAGLPPVVRRAVVGAGVGSMLTLGGPTVAAAGAASPVSAAQGDGTATMSVLPDEPARPEPAPAPDSGDGVAAPVGAASRASEASAPPDEWRVAPGDSFWSIAVELLGDALGRAPTDGEVAPYWRQLVEVNRSRLATGDPDLLFPGQVLTVPDLHGAA